jgi:hypothetical protein
MGRACEHGRELLSALTGVCDRYEKSKGPIFLKASSDYHRGMTRFFVLGCLALVSMAGCAIHSFNSSRGGGNSPCYPPPGVQDALIYPAPGATGIPDNIGEIIFASSALNGLFGFNARLIDETGGGTQVNFETFSGWNQATVPQPAATPPFSNPAYDQSINAGIGTGSSFPPGHLITVELAGPRCNPPIAYGSFTVQ